MSDTRRNPVPIDEPALKEMALAYVARYATTQARLRTYLFRKLRERGWQGTDGSAPECVAALVERFAQAGYVDDEAWARMRAASLARRGYGGRRIGQALRDAGIAGDICDDQRPDERAQRQVALILARKRRFGPFRTHEDPPDRSQREKQLAAMIRAGHPLDIARRIVDADDPDEIEQWADS